jgi:hypothetical protein
VAATLVVVAVATVAYGDRDSQQRAIEEMRDKAEYFAEKCGSRIDATIDWRSFAGKYKPSEDELSAGAYCSDVVESIGWICDNDQTTRAPMQRVHRMRCSFDGATGRELGLDLRGDELRVRLSWDTNNVSDRLKAWIENLPSGDGADATAPSPASPAAGSAAPSPRGNRLSVRQARERAAAEPELDALAAGVRAACDVAIPVAMDWASFEGHYRGGTGESSAVGWCSQQVEQIGKMCKRNAEEKRTIAREVKTATCHWDAGGGKDFKFSLESGALVVGYTWDSGDSGNNLIRYLWNTLD